MYLHRDIAARLRLARNDDDNGDEDNEEAAAAAAAAAKCTCESSLFSLLFVVITHRRYRERYFATSECSLYIYPLGYILASDSRNTRMYAATNKQDMFYRKLLSPENFAREFFFSSHRYESFE